MKHRGFTLLELVVVLALIGVSFSVGFRFIGDVATLQVTSIERNKMLSSARFAMERLRRELSEAYSPSVYISSHGGNSNRCVNYVPMIIAGGYAGSAQSKNATFLMAPSTSPALIGGSNMAISPPSATANNATSWHNYPSATLPTNVTALKSGIPNLTTGAFNYTDLLSSSAGVHFAYESPSKRYALLAPMQVRYCLTDAGELQRQTRSGASWQNTNVMFSGLKPLPLFGQYDESKQLIKVDLTLNTKRRELVLSSLLRVNYEY